MIDYANDDGKRNEREKEKAMVSKTVVIEKGYEADIIPYLVQSACHYESSLYIIDGSKKINMKSIMGMSILQLVEGKNLEIIAEGSDEEKAIRDLTGCFITK